MLISTENKNIFCFQTLSKKPNYSIFEQKVFEFLKISGCVWIYVLIRFSFTFCNGDGYGCGDCSILASILFPIFGVSENFETWRYWKLCKLG